MFVTPVPQRGVLEKDSNQKQSLQISNMMEVQPSVFAPINQSACRCLTLGRAPPPPGYNLLTALKTRSCVRAHAQTAACDLRWLFASSSSCSFSPPLAPFCNRMFLWHAAKQRGRLARIPSCAYMGRCQGVQFPSACRSFGRRSAGIFFSLMSSIFTLCSVFSDSWSMRSFFLLLAWFCSVLPPSISFSIRPGPIHFKFQPVSHHSSLRLFRFIDAAQQAQLHLCLLLCVDPCLTEMYRSLPLFI